MITLINSFVVINLSYSPILVKFFISLLGDPHERLLEGGEETHSAGLLGREHLHDLLHVDNGGEELVLVLVGLLTRVRDRLLQQVVWHEKSRIHRL